jgi:hypothetical protein
LKDNEPHPNSIDAVITWVDGSDPVHREKRLNALKSDAIQSGNPLPTGKDKTRFIDNNEIKYCIHSIRRFAPWIRNIYLITDRQSPDFLTNDICAEYRVIIVDHKEIFESYEWALPTFNSRTIETALWRIPGLADRFIYFNDDFILTAPVKPDDFFKGDKVVLRGIWKRIIEYGPIRMKLNHLLSRFTKNYLGITRSMHLLYQILGAKLAGFQDQYYKSSHLPHPIHTSTLRQFFDDNPDTFRDNIKYPFRDTNQFSALSLASHIEIRQDNAHLLPTDTAVMINGEMDTRFSLRKKSKQIENGEVQFLCIQGLEKLPDITKRHLTEILNALLELDEK